MDIKIMIQNELCVTPTCGRCLLRHFSGKKSEGEHRRDAQQQKKTCLGLCVQALISDSTAVLQPSLYQPNGRAAAPDWTLQRWKHLRLVMSEAQTGADSSIPENKTCV